MTPRYSPDSARLDRIKHWMQAYVDEQKFAGSSVLITQSGKEVFFHATGQRDGKSINVNGSGKALGTPSKRLS